ncbi:MAG TPA: DUF2157 domain-containing protein [Vicinamibacterales bacterium]|nr:DUF2157 domain-containing protein [Vicinamibacterales bacterium]
MAEGWERFVDRWTAAGVIDADAAARIRAFEGANAGSNRLKWPIWIALAFGVITLGAGALLFVAAHWDTLSPSVRFGLVVLLVGGFHVAAAAFADRFPAMATALHTVGTIALGGGIFLAGQIFNLDEHWPSGVMMWAFGAAIAWALLRSPTQLVLTALLTPAWLASEWIVVIERHRSWDDGRIIATFAFLLALTYLSAVRGDRSNLNRRAIGWLGAVALPFAAVSLALLTSEIFRNSNLPQTDFLAGWAIAIGIPLAVAAVSRRMEAWPIAVAAAWVAVLIALRPLHEDVALFAWWGLGATGLAAWGVSEARPAMINFGAAAFAVTVLAFYFSRVMDMLARSTSLIGLGLLFLAGGWAIERVRRQLVHRVSAV